MNIKERAYQIASVNMKNKCSPAELEDFAEALIAEVAKQNEPVAFKFEDGSVVDLHDMQFAIYKTGQKVWPLYTLPPTAEEIANETAWQPIETAPESGRFLTATKLTNGKFGQIGISHSFYCHVVNNRGWKLAGDDPHATHWMPLPSPPAIAKGEK